MRVRVTFKKTDAMRFTGHLDLFRTLERTMRRAELPLGYSEGFSPHPKMMLASALPLGVTSDHEVGDFWLDEELPIDEVETRMREACPPGVQVINVEAISEDVEKLQNAIESATYRVTLLDAVDDLEVRVAELMACDDLVYEVVKKGNKKVYNYRERVIAIELLPADDEGHQLLLMRLNAHQTNNGRADEVLNFLGIDPLHCRIKRVNMTFA